MQETFRVVFGFAVCFIVAMNRFSTHEQAFLRLKIAKHKSNLSDFEMAVCFDFNFIERLCH